MSKLAPLVASMLLVTHFAVSQNLPPILQADKPKRGIYLSFEEFLSNNPSVQSEFELLTKTKGTLGGKVYTLLLKKSDNIKKRANKFWGVSTGDSVYVNISNYQAAKGYIKLLAVDRYCYTKGITSAALRRDDGSAASAALLGGLTGAVISSIPREAGYIMNINNGKFSLLSREVMLKILSRDSELLNAYSSISEKEKKDDDLMLSYIERYNERHQDEIGKIERLAKAMLYRREKREKTDTVNILTGDSLQYALGPGELNQVSTPENTITLCSSAGCKTFNLNFKEITYIECSYREGSAQVQLLQQEKVAGEFYIKEIKIAMDKRQKQLEEQ